MLRAALALAPVLLAAPLAAEPQIISAPAALEAVQSGQMILLDIRRPSEWAATGVAKGAVALTMHDADFGPSLGALLAAHPDRQIGMICATGGRTSYVVSVLEKNGIDTVIDVSEGMMGNARGPGWIARKLPLSTSQEAQQAYADLMNPSGG